MVEGARLESVFRGNSNGGSNPLLSASFNTLRGVFYQMSIHKKSRKNPPIVSRGDFCGIVLDIRLATGTFSIISVTSRVSFTR